MGKENINAKRRNYIKTAGVGIVGLAVGAAAGYYAAPKGPAERITETKTETMMKTVTEKAGTPTVTPTATLPLEEQVPTFQKDIYQGQKIIIETEAGLQEEQFFYYGEKFKEMTGCDYGVSPIPVGVTYEKLWAEFAAGTSAYDVIFLPPYWTADVVPGGYLLQLDDYFKEKDPWLDDILPAFKDEYMKWGGHYYGITADGDVFLMYYRKDLFAEHDLEAPKTWEEYNDLTKYFTEIGGGSSWGSAEDCTKGEAAWWFLNRFGSMGGRLFNPETMEPEINSPAGVKAMESEMECIKWTPAGNMDWDCTLVRNTFYQGNLGMFLDWPDPGIEVEDPEMSKVTGDKTGFALVPGSEEVYDNDNLEWVSADDLPSDIKEKHVYDGVYHAPSMGYGCILCVASSSKYPDAAYDFIRYFTSPKISLEVVSDKYVLSGLDPFRYSHVNSTYLQEKTPGYKTFLAAEEKNIIAGYPDMRIRGAEGFLDTMQTYQLQALAGQISAKAAVDTIASEWKDLINRLGKEEILQQWQASEHTPYGP